MWIAESSSLADMDVDCDGANSSRGKCANDRTGQSITAFQDEVSTFGIRDLDANLHSYVILGTKKFDPRDVGVESLSIVAVVCNNRLVNMTLLGPLHGENSMLFLAWKPAEIGPLEIGVADFFLVL